MASGKGDYYDLLGVEKNASAEEIKKAYRKQALEWHPDRHKDNKEAAEKRFKEINEAYQVLSDQQKRAAYDQYGHSAFSPGGGFSGGGNPFSGQGGQWGPFSYSYSSSSNKSAPFGGFDFGDPFEIFESFFGGASPFRAQRLPRYSITIDFMEAVKGVEKDVSVNGKKRTIKIPAGVDDGSRIQFGEFILSINVKPHAIFERDGEDIYVRALVPYSTAVLGGEIEVPTIDDTVLVKIRAGTPSGSMLRLKERGISRLRGRGRGDQYVRLIVEVPQKLSKNQKKIIEQIREEGL